ncbi:hypothetical protein LAZ67_9001737 [Cordylochernes scorpioides]|uniref:Reverse transcriptase domain-containing protein n=1 Tax=Cordylochernes scorpioides TaxID=51811 RepID=A0ABY6KV94_9ARAC|nr:hypothetical protein LAZ67_9001737 [Cordylochernes scorpioides]
MERVPIAEVKRELCRCYYMPHHPEDADYQRILWRPSPEEPVVDYRLLTVTYGTTSAPFLAMRTLQQLAEDEGQNYPEASRVTLNDFYVDDLLTGAQTIAETKELIDQLKDLMKKGGFHLRKWNSNCHEIVSHVEEMNEERKINLEKGAISKILGIVWDHVQDTFRVNITLPEEVVTKRHLLSNIARIFDPLGFLSPTTVAMANLQRQTAVKQVEDLEGLPVYHRAILKENGEWPEVTKAIQCSYPKVFVGDGTHLYLLIEDVESLDGPNVRSVLYQYHIPHKKWIWRKVNGFAPIVISKSIVYASHDKRVYFVGGRIHSRGNKDWVRAVFVHAGKESKYLWKLNLKSKQWTELPTYVKYRDRQYTAVALDLVFILGPADKEHETAEKYLSFFKTRRCELPKFGLLPESTYDLLRSWLRFPSNLNQGSAAGGTLDPLIKCLKGPAPDNPTSLNWGDTEMEEEDSNDGFTVVRSKKRRRESANSPTAAAHSSSGIGGTRTNRQPHSSAGRVPRAQEIRTTRAHIVEARARQASSTEEQCVYIERCPELEPFHYLSAIDRMVGGTAEVIQISKMNGHFFVGLPNRALAERLIPQDALTPYGRVTSIAPKLMKAGPYIYNDGCREAFIALHEGVAIERLPTRLDITINGEAWPAYLTSGIRCSRCHGQGHPSSTSAPLFSHGDFRHFARGPSCAPPIRCTSAISTSASDLTCGGGNSCFSSCVPCSVLAGTEGPVGPRPTMSEHPEPTPPARPDLVAPRGPLPTQETLGPATPTPDIEKTAVDETTASSTSSIKRTTRDDLVVFLRRNPGVSFARTDSLGLGREEVLDLLSSKNKAQRHAPMLAPPQSDALAGLIDQLLDLRPGGNSKLYKILRQVKAELKTIPAAVTPTPPLPAPWPSEPTPPTSHREELTPAMTTPPPMEMEEYDLTAEEEQCTFEALWALIKIV